MAITKTNKYITKETLGYNNEKMKEYIEEQLAHGGTGTYSNPSVQNAVGGVPVGYKFDETPISEVLDKLFSPPYTKPTIAIKVDCLDIYDKNNKASFPSIIKITATVTKKTEDITEVSAYIGDTLIEKKTSLVKDGGSFTFNYIVPATFATSTFKVECKDGKNTVSATKKIYVLAQSYYGCLDDGVDINEENIKTLTPVLKSVVAGKYSFTTVYGRIVHAIPEEVGKFSSIKDIKNNLDYWNSYNIETKIINGEKYQVAYLIDPMGFTGAEITFG